MQTIIDIRVAARVETDEVLAEIREFYNRADERRLKLMKDEEANARYLIVTHKKIDALQAEYDARYAAIVAEEHAAAEAANENIYDV